MSNLVTQPSKNPTVKLAAATIAGGVMAVFGLVLKNLAPTWYDPEVILAVTPLVGFATGWLFRDHPNIVVVVESEENPNG